MAGYPCKNCGALMALSDKICMQCGTEADPGRLAAVFLEKAEGYWAENRWYEAAEQYRRALSEKLENAQALGAWHRLGLSLEKMAAQKKDAALLEQAGQAYEKGLEIDPGSEMLHQLWIANMSRRGLSGEAVARYNKILAAEPGQELATKMKKVASLAAEFKVTPVQVVSSVAAAEARGPRLKMLGWFLNPSPMQIGIAVVSTLMNLASCVYFALSPPGQAPLPTSEADVVAHDINSLTTTNMVQSILGDPSVMLFSTLLTGLWTFYLIRARKTKRRS